MALIDRVKRLFGLGPKPTPLERCERTLAQMRAQGRHGYVERVIEGGKETLRVVETDPANDEFKLDEARRARELARDSWGRA